MVHPASASAGENSAVANLFAARFHAFRFATSLLIAGILTNVSIAQNLPLASASADQAWSALGQLSQPATGNSPSAGSSLTTATADPLQSQINQFIQVAQSARDYYTSFPGAAHAEEASKLEAISAAQALQLGASDPAGTLRAQADAYRQNTTKPSTDRFDVALALDLVDFAPRLRSTRLVDNGTVYADLLVSLYREFGATPQVCSQYASFFRTNELADAVAVANIITTQNFPDNLKAQARQVLARRDLVGKKLTFSLPAEEGDPVNFSSIKNVTIVYFWNPAAGLNNLAPLAAYAGQLPSGVDWIYVALGSQRPALADVKAKTRFFPGKYCFDAASLAGAAAQTMGIQGAPYVAVIKPKGILAGFGRVENLPAVLATAGH